MKHASTPQQRGSGPKPVRRLDCSYTYRDPSGRELFQHVRWRTNDGRGKDFSYRWRPHHTAPWIWQKPKASTAGYDADHYLWQLPAVQRAIRAGEPVWWPEGERDALELGKAGVVATSHHGGAGSVHIEQCAWLRGARRVVLAMDRDVPGAYDALMRWRGLVEHAGLPPGRVQLVYPQKGSKDAADHLAAGYGLPDFKAMSVERLRKIAAKYTQASAARAGYAYTGLTIIKGGRGHAL